MGRDKFPEGISIRKGKTKETIYIAFTYKDAECREPLKNVEPTAANIKYAERLRGEILLAIAKNTFRYGEYFPESKRVSYFDSTASKVTLGKLFDDFLRTANRTLAHSTAGAYAQAVEKDLRPALGEKKIAELTAAEIRKLISEKEVTLKTMRNILTPLRAVLELAITDGIIKQNPMDSVVVKKLITRETAESDYEVDPFSDLEREQILANTTGQIHNLLKFAFFSGLRTSEWIALEWRDIDFAKGIIKVRRARTRGKLKETKTKAGKRDVLMLPPAREALVAQREFSGKAGKEVFLKPQALTPFMVPGDIANAWHSALRRAKVVYRNPYQTRHSYASMLLSRGENLMWVSNQLGHMDPRITLKVYSRWIPQNAVEAGYVLMGDYGVVSHVCRTEKGLD